MSNSTSDRFPRQDAALLGASQELLDYWDTRASRRALAALLARLEALESQVGVDAWTTVDGDYYTTVDGDRYLTAS